MDFSNISYSFTFPSKKGVRVKYENAICTGGVRWGLLGLSEQRDSFGKAKTRYKWHISAIGKLVGKE